ncbi:hypothetical protein J6590_037867, partial [Homalodisca vitripennis]
GNEVDDRYTMSRWSGRHRHGGEDTLNILPPSPNLFPSQNKYGDKRTSDEEFTDGVH